MSYYNLQVTYVRFQPVLYFYLCDAFPGPAHYFKGNALTRLGKPELALAPVTRQKQCALTRTNTFIIFTSAWLSCNLGQKGPGEEHLKQAVEIKGSFAPARYELARVYGESSRDGLAREQLEAAIKADPEYLSLNHPLSQVYSRLGHARRCSERTLEQFRTLQRKQHEEEK